VVPVGAHFEGDPTERHRALVELGYLDSATLGVQERREQLGPRVLVSLLWNPPSRVRYRSPSTGRAVARWLGHRVPT
jgi:hypothetical protein